MLTWGTPTAGERVLSFHFLTSTISILSFHFLTVSAQGSNLHGCKSAVAAILSKSAVAAILSTLRSHFLTVTSFLHGGKGECSLGELLPACCRNAVAAILSFHFLRATRHGARSCMHTPSGVLTLLGVSRAPFSPLRRRAQQAPRRCKFDLT